MKADIISAVEFDHTGDYLATGDKGGRVVLFERNDGVKKKNKTMNGGFVLTRFTPSPIEKRLRVQVSY